MIELALASMSIFGLGDWMCTSSAEYEDGMQEHIQSHVSTTRNLDYEETLVLEYQQGDDDARSRLRVFVSGYKEVAGHSFIAYPEEVELSVELDEIGLLTPAFLESSRAFYQAPSAPIEVVSLDEHTMTLRLKETGEETTCQAVSAGA
ncbi:MULTISPECIES: hypothetical protein [unclassified Halomonas]|uniref:hypothetical protein n=1 Tax=unclassified Halomonas TaxID=2609666 RepID=UPI002076877C|nr:MULTISPECIES: hypothetical protein [unclassified Halomonas]